MKYLRHTIIAGATSLVLVGGVSAYQLIPREDGTVPAVTNAIDTTVEPVTEEVAVMQQPEEPISEPAPVQPAPAPSPAPVLTTQEYGLKYLDLTNPLYQKCFDRIVSYYAGRFTPDVRERNVKALRVFADLCATGVNSMEIERSYREGAPSLAGSIFERYGPDGAFFDSDLAATMY